MARAEAIQTQREAPRATRRGSAGDGGHGVADRHIAVGRHDGEGKDGCEPIDGGEDMEETAGEQPEDPVLEVDGDDEEGKTEQEEKVRQGQVHDVPEHEQWGSVNREIRGLVNNVASNF